MIDYNDLIKVNNDSIRVHYDLFPPTEKCDNLFTELMYQES